MEPLVYHNIKLKSTYKLIKLFYQDSLKKTLILFGFGVFFLRMSRFFMVCVETQEETTTVHVILLNDPLGIRSFSACGS